MRHFLLLFTVLNNVVALWQQIDLQDSNYDNICDNLKSDENIFMKLEIRIGSRMEIMHNILSSRI
jgi:hypothetical protein